MLALKELRLGLRLGAQQQTTCNMQRNSQPIGMPSMELQLGTPRSSAMKSMPFEIHTPLEVMHYTGSRLRKSLAIIGKHILAVTQEDAHQCDAILPVITLLTVRADAR